MQVEGCSRQPFSEALDSYFHHQVDVTDEEQVKEMVSIVKRRHDRLDVVICNAGTALMNHVLLTPVSAVDKIMRTNFLGTFLVCRESAKLMKRRRYGRIVTVSSVALPMMLEGEAIYAAAKSAVAAFTGVLARELAQFGITCNTVGPAPVETNLLRSVPKEKIERIVERLAIKRLGEPRDIANVIDFFVSRESDYVTGQVVYLGGV
jgi:3-oxoacyl-[acyl-carrier protein] reductase